MGGRLGSIRHVCLIALLIGFSGAAPAQQEPFTMPLPSGQQIDIERFAGSDGALLLWLPSERGIQAAHAEQARALAARGYEVWLADLHAAYFLPAGPNSIDGFPLQDVVAIVDRAARSASAGVILVSTQRGAQLALIAAREWQLRNPGNTALRGVLLLQANLYDSRPQAGRGAEYLPIARATNLPVYLLDAQYSANSAHIRDLAEVLAEGGSQVYTQVLGGVQGGYFVRDEEQLDEADRRARANFANDVSRAAKILRMTPTPATAAAAAVDTARLSRPPEHVPALRPLGDSMPTPDLVLGGYRGLKYDLRRQRGRVTLVNFWASWCKPCVEEIPSLHRLKARIGHPDFDILTVNVGESRERIEAFLQQVPMELPLLMDIDQRASKAWKIYVYPTSYLIDREGIIRYAYLGALEWDSPENIEIIQRQLRRN